MKRIGDLLGFDYRKWEQSGDVYVFATDRVELSYVETTMATISDVIDEFNLPLRIVTGWSSW